LNPTGLVKPIRAPSLLCSQGLHPRR
jgi:hypothetical protein